MQFRKEHKDIRVIKKRGEAREAASMNRMASVGAYVVNSNDCSFGKPNRAQTPVKGIITGEYGQAAEEFYKREAERAWRNVSA